MLLDLPTEIILHIFSYLDLPELAALSKLSPGLASLAADPVLQRFRLLVVAPSRVQHSLFALSPQGDALRPTIADLVHRGVIRGLGIERRWRLGMYIYSPFSVKQYENLLRLQRRHTCDVLSIHFRRRSAAQKKALDVLRDAGVLPDAESSSMHVSRSLIPVMHQLKWSIQRDRLAKVVRDKGLIAKGPGGPAAWLEAKGRTLVKEGERVRLALCPGVRKIVKFYEELGR
ncbi:hypothetical protein GLOTRDRAFT_135065 [Gloeophyllum trabeum ATCC 11539]|uniref:F-box domain-containing protein n=1 Tax=Gloeophyllum trabeum (strain ATCC 11539 / FP-39264 / Madison 617) TaxID=670483 RepID=S7QLQ4_GLOTA|nr:uncharacterized protein GLOTRDRAFT_135065 [Gloeophyllum trabeum ATCC 11539]EPQ60357.1 hypothetical protein GLOTRDRAFT_135065 [Gloeophyllum trabeum ATCC 11539]